MALLQKLKSLLGLADSSSQSGGQRDVGVTVEREADPQASTGTENAVKGTDAGTEATAAGTDAAASTGSTSEGADGAAEPAEAPGASGADAAEETEAPNARQEPADDGSEPAAATEEDGDEDEGETEAASEDVEVIKGIGPAYASRLSDVGIETVADLAAADAEEVAEGTDLSPKRVGQWIERAKVR